MDTQLTALSFYLVMTLLLTACAFDNRPDVSKEENAVVYTQLGTEYLRQGKLNVALEKLQKAVLLDSKNVEAHDAIAVLYEKLREYAQAKEHFEAAIKLRPDSASTLNNYGRFLCDRGEYDAAMTHLKRAAELPLNDSKWFALTNMGRCELLRGNQDTAESNFRQALDLQPKYAPALLEMQRISYRQNNFLSARAFLQRYTEVAEQTAGTLWVAIETEKSLGNLPLANQYLEQLLQKFPTSNEAKQMKAAAY